MVTCLAAEPCPKGVDVKKQVMTGGQDEWEVSGKRANQYNTSAQANPRAPLISQKSPDFLSHESI